MKHSCTILSFFLLLAGVCGTEIQIPSDASAVEKYAAEETARHLQAAGLADVKIVSAPSGKDFVIRLGRAAGLDVTSLPKNGARVRITSSAAEIAGRDGSGDPLDTRVECGTLFGVYDFLEKELGVRWLWPGETGTYVPRRESLNLTETDYEVAPPMTFAVWRIMPSRGNGWSEKKAARAFYEKEKIWLRRHRFNTLENLAYGHAFTTYMKRFGRETPEIFNLLPDGSRRPDPLHFNGNPGLVSMCVSSPKLIERIFSEWKKKPADLINVNENDTAGKCVCPACLALDGNPDEGRVARAKERFLARDPQWFRELGSLTERYASFYLAVQREAEKAGLPGRLIACIYANYYEPPVKNKLNDRIIMRFCPPIMYPWTAEKVAEYKRLWQGWVESGASLMMRPNFTWDGHNMPLIYYREFADCFDFAKARGLRCLDFDSLTGMFGANGLTLYVIASKCGGCTESVAELENDFFAAFGPAESAMREYIGLMARVSAAGPDDRDQSIEGGNYADFFLTADRIFTPQVMAEGKALLEKAAQAAAGDPVVSARIRFVQAGLADAECVLETQRAFRVYRQSGDFRPFSAGLRKLTAFRKAHEHLGYADLSVADYLETRHWPMHFAMLGNDSCELKNWTFRFDEDNCGVEKRWFDSPEGEWSPITTDQPWEKTPLYEKHLKAGGKPRVAGWYRCVFSIPELNPEQNVRLSFGAVDGDSDIWLNGEWLMSREYPDNGDPDSWKKPFGADLTGKLKTGENVLTVRVFKKEQFGGFSGIWRSVYLSFGEVAVPDLSADGWKTKFHAGKFTADKTKYPLILRCSAASESDVSSYRGIWGKFYRTEPVMPGRTYEVKVRFRQKGSAVFSVWLRSENGGLGKGNINLSAPKDSDEEQTLTGRIEAGSGQCSIHLNLLNGTGEVEILSVRFYPVSTFPGEIFQAQS